MNKQVGKHGKTHVDGHFGFISNVCEDYTTYNESGINNTSDICSAIKWGTEQRASLDENITYLQMNMDIDGPYKSEFYLLPCKQLNLPIQY